MTGLLAVEGLLLAMGGLLYWLSYRREHRALRNRILAYGRREEEPSS